MDLEIWPTDKGVDECIRAACLAHGLTSFCGLLGAQRVPAVLRVTLKLLSETKSRILCVALVSDFSFVVPSDCVDVLTLGDRTPEQIRAKLKRVGDKYDAIVVVTCAPDRASWYPLNMLAPVVRSIAQLSRRVRRPVVLLAPGLTDIFGIEADMSPFADAVNAIMEGEPAWMMTG